MKTLENLLVLVDPSADKHTAVERATWLAERSGADIELFVCEYDPYLARDKAAIHSQMTHHREALEVLAEPLRERGIAVRVDARWDRPLDEGVARKVIASLPDVVFKDTDYHSPLRRTLLSHADWNLIRSCPAPLWLVKSREYGPPVSVLAAVDPMHEHDKPAALDREILAGAKQLADLVEAELHVVHVFDAAPVSLATTAGVAPTVPAVAQPSVEVIEALVEQHRKAFDELLQEHNLGTSQIHFEQGAVAEVLPDVAERVGAHVAVLGAISRGALKRIFIGSTAERVLDRLPCDLLVLKPPSFETNIERED